MGKTCYIHAHAAPRPGFVVENDAMDGDEPVLFAYTCDMPRIKRFDNALHIHDMRGTLYCFDFQEAALREIRAQCQYSMH